MKTILAAVILSLSAWFAVPALAEVPATPLVTVNINSASAAEIAETLKGIGMAKAEAIVAYRQENGEFESVDQLAVVKGIGPATVENNRERIALQ
ncbi:helix-hairpin-helix repeat-containing competence protein ComEA [Pseudomonas saudimassiliensis]|uniref:Helix-hairpin-helix repeat-containing competence protein ComEA n=1 Tax=Pseudomonas saudimassiliensis TaxID=1461581 RepID=A0A078ME27_9PSED|nr:ComEA family DNA-binding protein [Pseudomonas saudimassiliensis]CEA05608.1 helix-hairpin-helix repeat-containing competence protein ComEA [Pseudomonas saudimassiliensis]CEF27224.1 helix-hairpin-helix repeat-containing competence protein ComEA [Pseudomonas saudimassiliensis]